MINALPAQTTPRDVGTEVFTKCLSNPFIVPRLKSIFGKQQKWHFWGGFWEFWGAFLEGIQAWTFRKHDRDFRIDVTIY